MFRILVVLSFIFTLILSPSIVEAAPRKAILINLTTQRLYAMENNTIVFKTSISSGKDATPTPTGKFRVQRKLKLRTMRGCIGDDCWVVPNVPNVMYFHKGIAIHGTYWHNQFGRRRMSHGCVNVSLKAAEWLYNWTPIGTRVYVYYQSP